MFTSWVSLEEARNTLLSNISLHLILIFIRETFFNSLSLTVSVIMLSYEEYVMVAFGLLSLSRSVSSRFVALITGHGHLTKYLHRVSIFWEDSFCRMCTRQEEIAEHLPFDCPAIARECYTIFGSLDKDVGLIVYFRDVQKRPLMFKCMANGCSLDEEEECCTSRDSSCPSD
ncbi:hypothetical protein J6590_092627 [Homalodisca vitripennis]|nr:hypothetical protein J6590_092627 [Homalodisca vitripennis]